MGSTQLYLLKAGADAHGRSNARAHRSVLIDKSPVIHLEQTPEPNRLFYALALIVADSGLFGFEQVVHQRTL